MAGDCFSRAAEAQQVRRGAFSLDALHANTSLTDSSLKMDGIFCSESSVQI